MNSEMNWKLAELLGSKTYHQSMKSSWGPTTHDIPNGLIVGPTLFKSFFNDIGDDTEYTLRKSANYTRLGGVADTPKGYAVIQRDLKRLEK